MDSSFSITRDCYFFISKSVVQNAENKKDVSSEDT